MSHLDRYAPPPGWKTFDDDCEVFGRTDGPGEPPASERDRPRTYETTRSAQPALRLSQGRFVDNPIFAKVDISPDRILMRRAAAWPGGYAEIVRVTQRERMVVRFLAPVHLFVAYMQGTRCDGETVVGRTDRSCLKNLRQKFLFVPAGHEYREWYDPQVLPQIAYFYLDPGMMISELDRDRAPPQFAPKQFFEDPVLWETVCKIKTLIERYRSEDQHYLEALATVLVEELQRLSDIHPPIEMPARGGLAAWQQRVVTDYIEANVSDAISLATMSALVRLSQHHFCRAFRQSLGQPPGRYHGSRRIERAKVMLGTRTQSVTEIGLSLGYAETSSFTAAFRRATGVTPTAFRRSLA